MHLKRITTLIRQDLTNALRDNILLYMIFGPILLALGARLLLPSLDQISLNFAVQMGTSQEIQAELERLGQVQLYPDAEAVRQRVLRSDDVIGLVLQNGSQALLLEGNEGDNAQELASIISHALSGETPVVFSRTQVEAPRSLLTEYTAIIFIMIGLLLGALVMAFNIIEDKETRALKALGVSPLSLLEMSLARGLFALLLSLAIVLVTTLILVGPRVNYPLLLAGFGFSMALPMLIGYIVGGLADNQLKAIAILKFFMLVYLTLPIVSIFIPRSYHVFFYPLPNYWMWQTFENIFIGKLGALDIWGAGLVTLVSSLGLVFLLFPYLRRQLRLR
jgi:ABC-2 type transport system permease protein